jgi:hypothetical protein
MTPLQLILADVLAAIFAAAALASLPKFQPECRGWLDRFTWFFVRYTVGPATTLAVASWFLVGR